MVKGSRWRCVSLLGVLMAVTSCGGRGSSLPAAPSATTTTSTTSTAAPPSLPAVVRHLDGVITDGEAGVPISGATITQPYSSSTPATTDVNGQYTIAARLTGGDFGTFVWISKPGYEDTHSFAAGSNDGRFDFKLYRPVTMTAGTAIRTAITADNSMCGFDDEFRCRLLHVTAPTTGTLIVETAADNPADPLWVKLGTDVDYPVTTVTSLRVPATAGDVVTLLVFRPWSPPPSDTGVISTTMLQN